MGNKTTKEIDLTPSPPLEATVDYPIEVVNHVEPEMEIPILPFSARQVTDDGVFIVTVNGMEEIHAPVTSRFADFTKRFTEKAFNTTHYTMNEFIEEINAVNLFEPILPTSPYENAFSGEIDFSGSFKRHAAVAKKTDEETGVYELENMGSQTKKTEEEESIVEDFQPVNFYTKNTRRRMVKSINPIKEDEGTKTFVKNFLSVNAPVQNEKMTTEDHSANGTSYMDTSKDKILIVKNMWLWSFYLFFLSESENMYDRSEALCTALSSVVNGTIKHNKRENQDYVHLKKDKLLPSTNETNTIDTNKAAFKKDISKLRVKLIDDQRWVNCNDLIEKVKNNKERITRTNEDVGSFLVGTKTLLETLQRKIETGEITQVCVTQNGEESLDPTLLDLSDDLTSIRTCLSYINSLQDTFR